MGEDNLDAITEMALAMYKAGIIVPDEISITISNLAGVPDDARRNERYLDGYRMGSIGQGHPEYQNPDFLMGYHDAQGDKDA